MPDVVKILREADDATLRTLLPELIGVVEQSAAATYYGDYSAEDVRLNAQRIVEWASDLSVAWKALATAAAAVEKEVRGG